MARPPEHSNIGLLVIDVQVAVVADAHDRDGVLDNINRLVEGARVANAPVIWVQHNDDDLPRDSDGWQLAPELSTAPNDPVVNKQLRSSFTNTDLEAVLGEHHIGRLVVAGAQSDFCVRWTLHSALELGYDTVLVSDAHTTEDAPTDALPSAAQTIALLNNVWASQETSGPTAAVSPTTEVDFTN